MLTPAVHRTTSSWTMYWWCVVSFLSAVSLLFLAGCGGSSFIPSTAAQAAITVVPEAIDFGAVASKTQQMRSVRLINSSHGTILVGSMVLAAPNGFTVQGWHGPTILHPGQALQLQVAFAPQIAGSYSGTLIVHAVHSGSPISGRVGSLWVNASTAARSSKTVALHGSAADGIAPAGQVPSLAVSVSPASLSLAAGGSYQFRATVTGGSNKVRWSAALGLVDASGYYTAPQVTSSTVDTVSAVSVSDPSKYGMATVNVSGSSGGTGVSSGVYTITNQEPITVFSNPGSIFTKLLPSNILQHLAVANAYYPADSDTMIANQMAKANPGQRGGLYLNQMVTNQDQGQAKYYGQASDPYYVFTNCRRNSGDNIAPEHNAIGFPFHAPSGAMPNLTDGTDHTIRIWDQTTNTIISSYAPSSAFPACPGNTGHAGTYSDPCPLADGSGGNLSGYVGCTKFAWNEPVPYGPSGDGWGTNGIYPMSGMVRFQEIIQGHIYHMVYLDLNCSSGRPVVFPNSTGYTAHVCATPSTGIPSGALIFLDYNDAQLADMCPTPICATAGAHALPRWQYPFIEALSKYGGYFGDTMGDNSVQGITPARLESEAAYLLAGIPTPAPAGYHDFFQWLASQPHTNCIQVNGGYKCPAPIFENVPPEANNVGGSGTDIFSHMHVADQCIAKTLAGVAGGC